MNQNTTKVDQTITYGYSLDLGIVIEKAFENYKKIALIGGLAYLLIGLAVMGIALTLAATLFGLSDFTETMTNFDPTEFSTVGIVIYSLIMIVISGLGSPISAGFLKMAHLAENNQEFSVGTIFDYYKTVHFKDLFIAASLLALINLSITFLFQYLDYPIIGSLFTYIIGFFTLLYAPLIVFGNQNGIDSIIKSFQLVIKQPFIILLLVFIGLIGIFIGLIGLCIGMLFTLPFWSSMIYTIYNTALPTEKVSEIEEIGSTSE